MISHFLVPYRKLILSGFVLAVGAVPVALAFQAWEKPVQPPAAGEWTSLIPHPADSSKVIVGSEHQIFENWDKDSWKSLWQKNGKSFRILRLLSFKEIPDTVFVLTSDGLFRGSLTGRRWMKVYQGRTASESSVLAFTILSEDPDHWFLGTPTGLLESDDAGRSWFRFPRFQRELITILSAGQDYLVVGTSKRLYRSEDLTNFHPVFSLFSGDAREFLEIEELSDDLLEGPGSAGATLLNSDFHDVAQTKGRMWLGTDKGVFESTDTGNAWRMLPRSGLRNTRIRRLAFARESNCLFAGTSSGVYRFRSDSGRWEEIFQGLDNGNARALTVLDTEPETLVALTESGVHHWPIPPSEIKPVELWIPSPDKMSLFQNLIRLEPSARRIQAEAIRYANVGGGKIKRWQAGSRLKALLPSFSFGRDFSEGNNIDLDRGSTSDPDRYILGPDTFDRGWDMDVRWDLADFLYSSDQTSIDSREKLMVELRNDLLAEATRIYYERRRLQMEIVFAPAASERDHFEKIIRMDELTSLLDGMTDGYLSRELEKIYQRNPSMEKLWSYVSVQTSNHEKI